MGGFSTITIGKHTDVYHEGTGSVQTHADSNVNDTIHPNAERLFPNNQFLSINIALGG